MILSFINMHSSTLNKRQRLESLYVSSVESAYVAKTQRNEIVGPWKMGVHLSPIKDNEPSKS